MKPSIIGVLTGRSGRGFDEPVYFRGLSRAGKALGAEVVFFTEKDLDTEQRRIRGFMPGPGRTWVRRNVPWPAVVIDRRRRDWNPKFREMRNKTLFLYANHKFTLKSRATRLFAETPSVRHWIPKTVVYSRSNLLDMLKEFPIVYVKPGNGTGGSSVAKIKRRDGTFTIWGRRRASSLQHRTMSREQDVIRWFDSWVHTQKIRSGRFMVQQGLDLELVPGRHVDTRLLIQKNGDGEWSTTGMAVRIGGKNSPTTNLLFGDGKAHPFLSFMTGRFGRDKAEAIRAECERMALAVVDVIEKRYGSMMEFGLDVGIDVNGRVWLIEANPKPSRDVFLKSGEPHLYRIAVRRPVEYALYLMKKADAADS